MTGSEFYEKACELVPVCLEIRAKFNADERNFVDGLAEKRGRYKERSYLTEKQMNWLRALAKRAPDPRQQQMF